MRLYPRKGKNADGAIWIDDHPRNIFLTWSQFETICEVLNAYTSDQEVRPPKPKVKKLERYIVTSWLQQNRKEEPPYPD